jgi:hypothetical protein
MDLREADNTKYQELSATYDAEVEELYMAQDAKNEERDTKLQEVMDLREADNTKYQAELGVGRGWDRKIHSVLHGLDDALLGESFHPLLHFHSLALLIFLLVILAGAFPDSSDATAIMVGKYQEEYNIIHDKDSKANLSSVELAASVKGRLQPMAAVGLQLRTAVASVFKTLWSGWKEPSTASWLVQWLKLGSNRIKIWKESAAQVGAE